MAKQNRNTLKSYFETGKRPTESNYVNLIDSHLLLSGENTGSLNLLGNSSLDGNITITGNLTAGAGTLTSLGVGTIDVSSHITSSGNYSGSSTSNIIIGGTLSSATVNTGQGDNELYAMDQNVRTTDNVTFNNLTTTGDTLLGNQSTDNTTIFGNFIALLGNVTCSGDIK